LELKLTRSNFFN